MVSDQVTMTFYVGNANVTRKNEVGSSDQAMKYKRGDRWTDRRKRRLKRQNTYIKRNKQQKVMGKLRNFLYTLLEKCRKVYSEIRPVLSQET